MIVGVCRGGGDTRFSLFYDVFFMWTVAIPLAYTVSLTHFSYVWLIYALIMAEEPLKMVLGLIRLKSGRWLHCVI